MHHIALIGKDDRKSRNGSGGVIGELEASQCRVFCPKKTSLKIANFGRSNTTSPNYLVGNATLVFENDMAIMPRHMLANDDGSTNAKFSDCVIEHIASGDFYPLVDAEFDKDLNGDFQHATDKDYALVRLAQSPKGAKAISEDNIAINPDFSKGTGLKVVSNAADNFNKKDFQALTITSCSIRNRVMSESGDLYQYVGTDCDTGHGSSGALAFTTDTNPKVFGIVSGETKNSKSGSQYDPQKNATFVVPFDNTLIDLRDTLKSRTGI